MKDNVQHATSLLLIVPYGIETHNHLQNNVLYNLLIVPYGIETNITETKYIQNKNF